MASTPPPPLDLDLERRQDAHDARQAPGSARIIHRDPANPGTYTVLLDRCPCGAVVGECDCPALAATIPHAPVLTLRGAR